MLQNIRDRSTGWIAYVIVIGISIPFALWGIDQYFTGGNVIVAEVNEAKISAVRLNNEYQNRLQEMQTLISKDADEAELQKKIIKRSLLDELIDSVLVREFVKQNKFQVSEKTLISDIKNNKIFHSNKKFDPSRYQRLLESQGIKVTDYENIRISELKALQFYNNIVGSSFITSQQLSDLEALKYQTRNFKLLSLNYNDFIDKNKKSTEAEKKDFYVKYKNIFSVPEKFKIEYLVFNKAILKKQINTDLSNLKNYYQENKFQYILPEKRRISQIFLSNLKSDKEENSKLIKEIHGKIEKNSSFNEMVVKFSQDQLSNQKNGDIGWVSRDELAKVISDSIFSLSRVNDVSQIIETEQGFYILKLDGKKEAVIKKFEDIKDTVKNDYINVQVDNRYDVMFEDVSNILFESPDSLTDAEEYLAVSKVSTALATLSKIKKDHRILADKKVLEALSSKSVYKDGLNSQPIEVKNNIIMLRIHSRSSVQYKNYQDVEREIESLIHTENSIMAMKDTIKDIEKKIKNSNGIEEIEKLTNKKSTYYTDIKRTDGTIPPSILSKVFALTSKDNVMSIESGTGNYELILLDAINPGDSNLSYQSLKTMFYNEQVNSVLYSVIQSLREQAKIKIYSKNL